MADNDKPPDIETMEDFLRQLMVEGDRTDSVVRITMNPSTWTVTPPIVHQHLRVEGVVVKRDLRVSEAIFREACEKGYITAKVKASGVISCTERVISHKGVMLLSRCPNMAPAK